MAKGDKISKEEAEKRTEGLLDYDWENADQTLGGLLAMFAGYEQCKTLTIFGPSRVEGDVNGDREGVVLQGLAAIDPDRVNAVLKRLYPDGVPAGEDIFEYINA